MRDCNAPRPRLAQGSTNFGEVMATARRANLADFDCCYLGMCDYFREDDAFRGAHRLSAAKPSSTCRPCEVNRVSPFGSWGCANLNRAAWMSMLSNFKVIAAGITGNLGRYECQRSLNTFAIVNLPTVAVLSLWVARPFCLAAFNSLRRRFGN